MIWALLTWYFLGGASGINPNLMTSAGLDDLAQRMEIAVPDRDRREDAMELLGNIKKDVRRFKITFAGSGLRLNRLYKDHSGDPEKAQAILDKLNADWQEKQEHVLDSWFELRGTLTEDEWNRLFAPQ